MEIKLPRLKVEVQEDDHFSLGKLSPSLIIGFGIHWSWVYLTMFNGGSTFFWNAAESDGAAALFHIASLVWFTSTLLAHGVFSRALRRLLATPKSRKHNRLRGACLASAGTLLMGFAETSTPMGWAVLVAGGMATGVGSAILLMSYSVSFGQCDIATIVTSTALSLIVGIAMFVVVSNLDLLHPLGAIAVMLLPFVEYRCLNRCSTVLIDKLEFADITLKVKKWPFAWRICAPSLLFGFALGSIRGQAIADMHLVGGLSMQMLCIGLAGIVACVLMIAVMLQQRQHVNFMFRTMLPLIAIALAVVFLIEEVTPFTTFAFLLCYLLFEGMMWVSYGDISQRFRLTSFIVFGFGRGSLALGAMAATMIATFGGNVGQALDSPSAMVVTLACIIAGFGALPRGSEIRNVVISESESPADEVRAEAEPADEETAEKARAGWFKRKCLVVANRYLLSKKETEVLFLLAKGRNAAYIQEQLYISEGTARTHMRHIYKKLDIHTQQELIDLVDGAEETVS